MTDQTPFKVDAFGAVRKFFSLLVPVIVVVAIGTSFYLNWRLKQYRHGEVIIDGRVTVSVMVADTPEKQQKGLSVRDSLSDGEGMLFEFPRPDRYRFWMKDMVFPIDIIWILDEEIVDITFNLRTLGPDDKVIPGYEPAVPANRVLEVPAGFVARNGLRLGMPVSYRIDTK